MSFSSAAVNLVERDSQEAPWPVCPVFLLVCVASPLLFYRFALLILQFSFLSHHLHMPLFSLCGNYPAQPLGYPNTSHSPVVILAAQVGRGS